MRKSIHIIVAGLAASTMLSSCFLKSRGNNPGLEYAPDMYDSKGYEPYSQKDSAPFNPYGMNMREPVKGSIALGKEDFYYAYPNNGDGYEAAGKELDYPSQLQEVNGRGKYLYDIYCLPCHGANGGNDGAVFKKHATLKPTWKSYGDPYIVELPVGKIYHTLTYGKNNMGSHASVLTPVDRWRVIKYVKELSLKTANSSGSSTAASMNADSTKANK